MTKAKKPKTKTLRVGIIGLGMGRNHIDRYRAHPGAKVVAIADVRAEAVAEVGDKYKIARRYLKAEEMLAKEALDVVSIATPNAFHKPLTLAAFAAGAHVLCEKPMALSAAEGRDMLEAARQAGRRLMINFSYRFSPQSIALRAEVDKGVLGDIYFARTQWLRRKGMPGFGGWFGQKALSGGGPLIDLGVHRLDLALWLMGYPRPRWVLARTYDRLAVPLARAQGKAFDVEDLAAALVTFENGATLELTASWAAHIQERELMETRLLGTRGGLVQRNVGGGYNFEAAIYTEQDGKEVDLKPVPPESAPNPMVHFVDCILNDRPHTATGEEGLIVMELLDAIYASAEQDRPIQIL